MYLFELQLYCDWDCSDDYNFFGKVDGNFNHSHNKNSYRTNFALFLFLNTRNHNHYSSNNHRCNNTKYQCRIFYLHSIPPSHMFKCKHLPHSCMPPWVVQYMLNDALHNSGGKHKWVSICVCTGKRWHIRILHRHTWWTKCLFTPWRINDRGSLSIGHLWRTYAVICSPIWKDRKWK